MDFSIGVTQDGPGGWYAYVENGEKLPFEWEFSSEGVTIYVPTLEKWDQYCGEHHANWARGRREEILMRLAEGVRDRKAKGAKITIESHWVQLTFEDSWLISLLKKTSRMFSAKP